MTEKLMTVEECAIFAAKKHAERGYTYGDKDYSYHTYGVAGYVRKYSYLLPPHIDPDDVERAAHGHDLYEDCGMTYNDLISVGFGVNAAKMILAVSDVPGEDRIEKMYLTLPKVRREGLGAILLKMSDRAFNASQDGSMKKTYKKEYHIVKYILESRTREVFAPFWEELDELHGFGKTLTK